MNHLISLRDPSIDLYSSFLEPSLCAGIIESATELLNPSTVVSHADGSSVPNDCRTSHTAYLPASWSWLSRSIAELLGIDPACAETPQVQRYSLGAQYTPHHDYFYFDAPGGSKQIERGGQRVATALIYLNTVPIGGVTNFTKLGISVRPVQGSLLTFCYPALSDGKPDSRLMHSGEPVECGYKWIVTQWFREGYFK